MTATIIAIFRLKGLAGGVKKIILLGMEFLREYQLGIMLILIGICGTTSLFVAFTRNMKRSRRAALLLIEVCATLILVADRFAYMFRGDASDLGWWMVRISNFSVYALNLFLLYAFNLYLMDLFTHEGRLSRVPRRLRMASWGVVVGLVLLLVSQFTGLYYTFDSMNFYHRSHGMVLCYLFPAVILVLQFLVIIKYYYRIHRRIRLPLVIFTVFPILATIAQFFCYGLSLTNMSLVGCVILLYMFAIRDMDEAVDRAHRLEISILERYRKRLEYVVKERTRELIAANEKAETLLLNILPKDIARELTEHPGKVIAKDYSNVTVMFADIVEFTKISGGRPAEEVISLLNKMVSIFDERASREGVEKIKTIGDCYMAAMGLNMDDSNRDAVRMVRFAQGILEDIRELNKGLASPIQIRIGINTGSLVAGVIGKSKFIYDIWGDIVNVASRMESTGEPMKIHVTEFTYEETKDAFDYSGPVEVEVKGKGKMKSYFL